MNLRRKPVELRKEIIELAFRLSECNQNWGRKIELQGVVFLPK